MTGLGVLTNGLNNEQILCYFRSGYSDLYDIIGKLFPKCDYNSLNEIVGYLADSFFDITTTNESYTFAYQHRRFAARQI